MPTQQPPVDLDKVAALAVAAWTQYRRELIVFYDSLPHEAHLAGAVLAGLGLGLLLPKLRQPFRRFATVEDIPMKMFHSEQQLHARSVSVSDGDTFRARHVPVLRGAARCRRIRLAGIDTPETAKFGAKGQPFGNDAKLWLDTALSGKSLTLTLLHKDQYARAVCMVHYGRWPFRKNASEDILKAGLAHVYRQAGAVYGGRLDVFEKLEAQAQKKKLGIWSQGMVIETASEYKARQRADK